MNLTERMSSLIRTVSAIPGVQAIGKSGGPELPKSGENDIDLFVYCSQVPELQVRSDALEAIGLMNANTQQGGHWGIVDLVLLNGIETYLMYFTLDETINSIREIIDGMYPDKLDNYFYPTGRLATFLNMAVLHDQIGFLYSLKQRLANYPHKLSSVLTEYHLEQLGDTEDLQRAVSRSDVLFYHFALDLALDHFLQALFALNKTYFPSRKRSFEHIERFTLKPGCCSERLSDVIRLGSTPEMIGASYELWKALVSDLIEIPVRNL